MGTEILGPQEMEAMRMGGKVAARTLERVFRRVEVGATTGQIDVWLREDTSEQGAFPS